TLRESLPAERRVPGGVKVALCNYWFLLRDVRFIGFVMTGGCVMGSLFSYISGSPFVFIELHGVPPERYGLLFGLNAVGLIGASQLNHHLLKRYSSRAILRGSVVGFSIAAILVGVNAVTGIGGFVGFLVPLFVSVSALGFVSPNTTAAAMAMHGRIAGAASAFLGIAQFALGAVAASLVGLLADGTARPMGLMIAGCGLLALPMQHFSLRRRD
ncbi:MAG TPA: Bcr/CflA family drug resistance efflux transporter, partial [Alphaproteobacteria bacterium]